LSSQVLSTQVTADPTLGPWIRFLRAHAALTRQLSTRLESEHGLTLSDFDVLAQLYFAPERALRRIDIARQVLLTASGITRLLERLERAGWVAKRSCESDARVTYAVLTDEGLRKFEAARASHVADLDELFASRLTNEERGRLDELLAKLPLSETACAED
jgi:DNA-binding MarR family transcriptional regulator